MIRSKEFLLELTDGNNEDLIKKNKKRKPLGEIKIRIKFSPITKQEMNEILKSEKLSKGSKGLSISWSAVVHVVLVQARGLTAMDAGESSDPYCK